MQERCLHRGELVLAASLPDLGLHVREHAEGDVAPSSLLIMVWFAMLAWVHRPGARGGVESAMSDRHVIKG